MRRITIDLPDDGRSVLMSLERGEQTVSVLKQELPAPIAWEALMLMARDLLGLDPLAPPGTALQGAEPPPPAPQAWKPVHFNGLTMHGWAWGFWLPNRLLPADLGMTRGLVETCCGFRDAAASERGANRLQVNAAQIEEFPNGTYEAFACGQAWAFLDMQGDLHHGFPSSAEANSAAAKAESHQMQRQTNP